MMMTESRRWFWLAAVLVLGGLLYLLAPVLTPFLMGAILAYIGDPAADRLEAMGLSRTASVATVFVALFLITLTLLVGLLPMLSHQVGVLVAKFPGYIDWLQQQGLPGLSAWLGFDLPTLDLGALKEYVHKGWSGAGGVFSTVLGAVSRSGLTLLAWLANMVLVPVVTFYLLRDWDVMVARIRELLPRLVEPTIVSLARESDEVLAAFFRGQLTVMAVLGAVYSIGLWLVGLDLALLIGMLAGLVSFVPYLGFIVGILAAGIAALMQYHELLPLLYVAMVFGVGQMLEGMVLQPLLLGERIGLHPVAVIFAVLAGGQLFGFFGVLLALPVAAVIMVLLRYAHRRYLYSSLYTESGGPSS